MISESRKLRWLCLATVALAAAQLPGQFTMPLHVGPVYTGASAPGVDFPRMKVLVTSPVPREDLPQPSDLTLVEDGVPGGKALAVEPFGATGFGVAAIVAVDVSGSMAGGPLRIIRDSLFKFASEGRPQDAIAVMTIADDAVWEVPFDADRSTLRDSLQKMQNRGHLTRLYDGLAAAINGFDGKVPARKELTVITDGHDEGSRIALDDVVQLAKQENVAIDAIGLTRSEPRYLNDLSLLAQQTGGSFHQVHSDEELQALIGNGMAALKASPVATFQAEHIQADGKQHTLGIVWAGPSEHQGETTFTAPEQTAVAAPGHPSLWLYAVAGLAIIAVVALAMAKKRRAERAERESEEGAYSLGLYEPGPVSPVEPSEVELPKKAVLVQEPAEQPWRSYVGATPIAAPPDAAVPQPAKADRTRTKMIGIFQVCDGRVAELEVVKGGNVGATFDVLPPQFSIGRSPENQLALSDDKTVSGRHASLVFEDPMLMLVDHTSTNGTRINGELVREGKHPLCEGDQIQIGMSIFRLKAARTG